MKKYLIAAFGLTLLAVSAPAANFMANPGFTLGADGLDGWEGYNLPSASVVAPSNFVTVGGGEATVLGFGTVDGETAFYQTFPSAGGVLATGTYTWSATISNLTDTNTTLFIKVWDNDAFGGFKGEKYQNVPLSNGTMTLTYQHDPTDLVQFGFGIYTTNRTPAFTLSNPTLALAGGSASQITQSIFRLVGAAPAVSFTSENGVSYTLQATTNLAANPVDWQAAETRAGDGGTLTLGTNLAPSAGFIFRVVTP